MENNKQVKQQPKRGLWKPDEDWILKNYVETHGEGNWASVSKKLGLMRGGKSCRLRWKNYLRPNIKRGGMSQEEEDLIIRMHKLIGNRWTLIAGRLPGRTDNEVKNYWNTHLKKKCHSGKRKTTDNGDCIKNNNNKKKLPPMFDSQNTCEGMKGREERNDANMWTEGDTGGSFNNDLECEHMLIPPNNAATFVFDDDPFTAYLDSFLLLDSFQCNQ